MKIYHDLRIVALFYAPVCDFEVYYGLQMSDRDEFHEMSPPPSRKRPSGDRDTLVGHRKKDRQDNGVQQMVACALLPSRAGTSQTPDVNTATAGPSPVDDGVHRLRAVFSGLLEKLNKSPSVSVPKENCADFSGFLAVTDSEAEDGEVPESASDPLEELDALGCSQLSQLADVGGDDAEFLRTLEEFKGHFHGQEEKGEPLFDHLAGRHLMV